MKVLVFGATGPTGQQIVSQGLASGYEITGFVRDAKKIAIRHPNLTVVTGDVFDANAVFDAVRGHDVIISALGNGRSLKGTVFSTGMKNIVDAMKAQNLRRFIIMSAFGVGNSYHAVPIFLKMVYKTFLKDTFRDKAIGESYVKQSPIDWTLVHPVILTNGPKTGKYRSGEDLHVGRIPKVSRADVADFMLHLIPDDTSIRRTFVISR